jgi:asparagine synthase (glutamine-hydrolysing)
MCGVTGFWLDKNIALANASEILTRMTRSLDHRGPDSHGHFINSDDNLCLGHSRLSILDLSSNGHQPMESNSKRFLITFNGEIYNHLNIRALLENEFPSISWSGTSDTETLLMAIERWGLKKALISSNGMFAFGLWDQELKKLFFARDRIGEKPLYVAQASNQIIFSSELSSLRHFPNLKLETNTESIMDYFRVSYIGESNSIYHNVVKVPPGKIMEFTNPCLPPNISTYWSLKKVISGTQRNLHKKSSREEILNIENLLKDTVESQMISDVPLGSFLSGGIDSSLITALMQDCVDKPVKTFTIGFAEDNYNEAQHAEKIAEHLGTEHHSFILNESDALSVIPDLPRIYDEPFADYSQIPTLLLSREAKKHVSVVLTGDGGDEIFGGYNRYIFAPKIWKIASKFPPLLRRQVKFFGSLAHFFRNSDSRILNPLLKNSGLPMSTLDRIQHLSSVLGNADSFSDLFLRLTSTFPPEQKILRESLLSDCPLRNDQASYSDSELSHLREMMFRDSIAYLPGDILTKVDRASMSTSLETRAPFLDRNIIEAAWALPESTLIYKNKGKFILREILKNYMPSHLFERPKQGFTVPLDKWLRTELKEWAEDLLHKDKIDHYGYLSVPAIEQLWKDHQRQDRNNGHQLWTILMFQAWLERWEN